MCRSAAIIYSIWQQIGDIACKSLSSTPTDRCTYSLLLLMSKDVVEWSSYVLQEFMPWAPGGTSASGTAHALYTSRSVWIQGVGSPSCTGPPPGAHDSHTCFFPQIDVLVVDNIWLIRPCMDTAFYICLIFGCKLMLLLIEINEIKIF